nr:hypothetical protein [Tanacetum cinerariifolium]
MARACFEQAKRLMIGVCSWDSKEIVVLIDDCYYKCVKIRIFGDSLADCEVLCLLESDGIIMANLPPPNNDPNVPKDEQAPAAPDGFAPQWIGGHDSNNSNGWIDEEDDKEMEEEDVEEMEYEEEEEIVAEDEAHIIYPSYKEDPNN